MFVPYVHPLLVVFTMGEKPFQKDCLRLIVYDMTQYTPCQYAPVSDIWLEETSHKKDWHSALRAPWPGYRICSRLCYRHGISTHRVLTHRSDKIWYLGNTPLSKGFPDSYNSIWIFWCNYFSAPDHQVDWLKLLGQEMKRAVKCCAVLLIKY